MAEQEKKSGGANGSPVVVVEQTAASKHMPPYRAQELQEEQTEVHAKRSKGPAVSSAVSEDVKESSNKEAKESERAISLEKHVSKKVSSSTKRRAPSPDNIIKVSTVEVEPKKDTVPPQPIPAQLKLAEQVERKENKDDSIDDVTELRTAPNLSNDVNHRHEKVPVIHPGELSRWTTTQVCHLKVNTRENNSWDNGDYLDNVVMKSTVSSNKTVILERKMSIGPYMNSTTSSGQRSGICICVPKKSNKSIDKPVTQSVININILRDNNKPQQMQYLKLFKKSFVCLASKVKNVLNS